MATALLLCDSYYAFLMPVLIDELQAVGVLAHVDVSNQACDAARFDVVCVFWGGYNHSWYYFEQTVRPTLRSAKRTVLVALGTSDLTSVEPNNWAVVFCESPYSTSGTGYDERIWRRAVKGFVRDIQFDTRGLRRRVADVASRFERWLVEYKSQPPEVLPSTEDVRNLLSITAALASSISAPVVLARGGADHISMLLLAYAGALLLWCTLVLRHRLWSLVDRIDRFRRSLWDDPIRRMVLFGGSAFMAVWALSARIVPVSYPPAVLLTVWAALFIGAVGILSLASLRSRGATKIVLPSTEDIHFLFDTTMALAGFIAALVVLARMFPGHVFLVLVACASGILLLYTMIHRRLSSFVERACQFLLDLDGDWVGKLALFGGSTFVAVWAVSVRFVPVSYPLAVLLTGWAGLFIGAVVLHIIAGLPIRAWYHVAQLLPARSRACFISCAPEIRPFVDLLESEFARKGIAFYDGDRIVEVGSTNLGERSKYGIRFAIRNSGFVLAFISDSYFLSDWCTFELDTAKTLGRPTLSVVYSRLSTNNTKLVPPDSLSLDCLVREAIGIVTRHDAMGRRIDDLKLEEYLLSELFSLMARVCSECHGHGTELTNRTRLVPFAMRPRCSFCNGRGLSSRRM
jgi:hypothetical protein